jgi:hypothetical protein
MKRSMRVQSTSGDRLRSSAILPPHRAVRAESRLWPKARLRRGRQQKQKKPGAQTPPAVSPRGSNDGTRVRESAFGIRHAANGRQDI